jgi:hypothetical protein
MMMTEPDPILRVTIGAPVYTQDEQKIGKVKDVRGSSFAVEPGLFKRDYWLPADLIETAVPEEAVVLSCAESDLAQFKVDEAAAA